ncbi:MAG: hypothetical protein CVT60_03340 [Actinobacteria bacterium HGW-Actinobacteria-10]|jgi:hypothetical protein|nr:MAG: hypothetical protein CVT60_03340 [Actinobacteria bacterium HGW-Actinobacteria-10]
MKGTDRISHTPWDTASRFILAAMLACLIALFAPPSAHAESTTIPLGSLLASQTAGAPTLGQVERIAIGSRGATITLENGDEVGLDFSELAGVGGGPNYVGWAMVLFGLSVATRLISSVHRILRPFGRRGNRHDYD